MDVRFRVPGVFFDHPKLKRAEDKMLMRGLSRAGAFIRRSARSSIRKRKKTATPGNPPSSHTGLLKAGILFGYDPRTRSVVVGPTPLRSKPFTGIPRLLEHGGPHVSIGGSLKTPKPRRYGMFPFMSPALAANKSNIPNSFRNTYGS